MNHQAGPDTNDAEADAVDSTPAEEAAADSTPEPTAHDAPAVAATESETARSEADGRTGEAADHNLPAEASGSDRLETGEPRVDAALTLLDRLTELPVTGHAAVFERVHAELTAVLGQLDPESAGADD
jgi:hypothetical protein